MTWNRKLRVLGVALCLTASASMVTTPTYAAAPGGGGQRVQFHTTTAALEIVKRQDAALYQRLLAYRSGQDVRVTAKERAYLQRVNRMAAAAQTRATEFSSQSRVISAEARQARAQATTTVVVTPKPTLWDVFVSVWLKGSPLLLLVAPVVAPFVLIINLLIVIAQAIIEAWPKIQAALAKP